MNTSREPLSDLFRHLGRAVLVAGLLTATSAPGRAAEPASGGKAVGVAACSNAVCHGSMVPREGGNVLRNEYAVWTEKDHHAQAYNVLLNPRSKAIATRLGIGAAHEATVCLDCHSNNAPAADRGEKFALSDGVSCEGCHGAAGDWLEGHDDPGRTHEQNIAAGMTDLANTAVRAEVCTSCHVGDSKRFATHRIMAAGHPRTGFELDTFTFIQPRHYRVDDDYRRRKGEIPAPVAAWAVGQSEMLIRSLDRIAATSSSPAQGARWPEFALNDCFSCHQPMRDLGTDTSGARPSAALGTPGLLHASASMLAQAADVAGLPADSRVGTSLADVDVAMATGEGSAAKLASQASARALRGRQAFLAWKPTNAQLDKLLASLCSASATSAYLSYGDAEQATMAVQAVIASLDLTTTGKDGSARRKKGLDGLFAATRSESAFRREDFLAALRNMDASR